MDKNSNSAVMHSVMADIIERWTQGRNQTDTAIPGLVFHRWDTPTEPTSYTLNPNICMIAQGAKRVMLGEEVYVYDAASYLVSSMELPVVAQIIEASEEKPYLGLTLELDLKEISQLMADIDLPEPSPEECRGIAVSKVTSPLLNAVQRLLELLDSPDDIPILAPLVQREIFYRLLLSEQGPRLRHIVSVGSHGNQIARAIDWLKDNYDKQFQVKEVADHVWMSSSSFHKHFRSVTAMTPLQFQKRLRLNEARRLMLTENLDATNAAFQVGYESPSQFSREYSRLFGSPPLRDIKSLQKTSAREAIQ